MLELMELSCDDLQFEHVGMKSLAALAVNWSEGCSPVQWTQV